MRTPGKRVGRKASGVQIPPSPFCFAADGGVRSYAECFAKRSRTEFYEALLRFEMQSEVESDKGNKVFIVYILKSVQQPDRHYIGFTTNLTARLEEHNALKSTFSSRYAP